MGLEGSTGRRGRCLPAAAVRAPAAAVRARALRTVVEEDPTVAKINQLAELHAQGVLSDEEFTAAEAKVLGI